MITGIFVGSLIFVVLGVGISAWLKGVVSNSTKNLADLRDNLMYYFKKIFNYRLMYVSCALCTVCFWLLWFSMYMH